jgi:uncharacterized membrane protein
MRLPFAPRPLLLLLAVLVALAIFVQLGALTLAFDKLGLSPLAALLWLLVSLLGSAINLPLFTIRAEAPAGPDRLAAFRGLLPPPVREFRGRTLVAVNVGGGLVPVLFSLFLVARGTLSLSPLLAVIAVVTAISYLVSRPLPGIGIGMPVFVAPLVSALAAVLIDPAHSAPLAYVGGTLGVLIGADLLRFGDIRRLGTPLASIGGAGTFDGIFMTGIVAVLLT